MALYFWRRRDEVEGDIRGASTCQGKISGIDRGVVASTQVDRASPAWIGLRWSGSAVIWKERFFHHSVGASREGDR
jgi:hypothetical protein